MDDLSSQLTGTRVQTPLEEAWHTEQRRRQYDIIRVKNPTDSDFYVEYDTNQHQRVPANSTLDMPRYIAERYCKHMTDKIIHGIAQQMHDDVIKERNAKGFPPYKHKSEENEDTYLSANFPKTNDPKVAQPIWDKLWVGLVTEVGRDRPPEDHRYDEVKRDLFEVQMLKQLQDKRVEAGEAPIMEPTISPQQYASTTDVPPQSGFVPPSTFDFGMLNQSLETKVTPEEVTNNAG